MPEYAPFWLIADEKITSFAEVERRVIAGAIAVEISAEMQKREADRQAQALIAAERRQKRLAELEHKQSPEGKRQAALNFAAQHPGGMVSTDFRTNELEAFGPDKTNVLR